MITATVPADPGTVFAYFVEPELFAEWFVADGFGTPAAELQLDPRPGGAISGVMVSNDGATRVPLRARYGRIDPPHSVQFMFDHPDETVTIDPRPVAGGHTLVRYRKASNDDEDARGPRLMLGALTASIVDRGDASASPPPEKETSDG